MKKITLLVIAVMLSITAFSQELPKRIVKTDLSAGLNMNGGNNPFYGGTFKMTHSQEKGPWEFAFAPTFNLAFASIGETPILTRREGYCATSIQHNLGKEWKILGFSEIDHSFIRKIDARWNAGGGFGRKWTIKKLEIGLSQVFLGEGLSINNPLVENYFVLRSSTRAKFEYKTSFGSISSISFIQPAVYTNQGIGLHNHFILRSQNKLSISTSKSTSVGITYDVNYQSYPAYLNSNVLPMDWGTTVFFMYKIGK
jgi:hypothetical protein